jgi:hypothetical protein
MIWPNKGVLKQENVRLSPKLNKNRRRIDHIKPKSKFPELTFSFHNLQVLCENCNMGKSNLFSDDWRKPDDGKFDLVSLFV